MGRKQLYKHRHPQELLYNIYQNIYVPHILVVIHIKFATDILI